MTTLRLVTHVGNHARHCVFKQSVQQQKGFCSANFLASSNFSKNRKKHDLTNVHSQEFFSLLSPRLLASPICVLNKRFVSNKRTPDIACKTGTNPTIQPTSTSEEDIFAESSKLGLFARFKLMYKKYWYVLIPVHIVTSIGWFGGFYYLSQSGVDIPTLLSQLHVSDNIIEKVKNSSMGHLAIAYLCYKIATPLRYALTLGGTTFSIKYLVQAGHIKPMPTKQQFIDMYEQKKADRAAAKDKDK